MLQKKEGQRSNCAYRYSFVDSLLLSQMEIHEAEITRRCGAFIQRTSELFIYKCLTSRHRLGTLFSFFHLNFPLALSFSLFCRVIYARPGYTVVVAARERKEVGGNGEERKDQSAKEGSREDELSRWPSNEPSSLQRDRCYEKRKILVTSANKTKIRQQ